MPIDTENKQELLSLMDSLLSCGNCVIKSHITRVKNVCELTDDQLIEEARKVYPDYALDALLEGVVMMKLQADNVYVVADVCEHLLNSDFDLEMIESRLNMLNSIGICDEDIEDMVSSYLVDSVAYTDAQTDAILFKQLSPILLDREFEEKYGEKSETIIQPTQPVESLPIESNTSSPLIVVVVVVFGLFLSLQQCSDKGSGSHYDDNPNYEYSPYPRG